MTLAFASTRQARHFPHPTLRFYVGTSDFGASLRFDIVTPCRLVSRVLTADLALTPSQRGLLLPGFQRIGHPLRRRISLQGQLGKLPWWDFHPLDHQLDRKSVV